MARRLCVAALVAPVVTSAGLMAAAAPGDTHDPRAAGRAHAAAQAVRGCRDKTLVPTAANLGRIRTAMQCLINERRRSKRLRPLRVNADLGRAAQSFSSQMVREHFFDHVGPDGSTLSSRVEHTRYIGNASNWWLGENLHFDIGGQATPLLTVRTWMVSPQHRIHVLHRRYRDLGMGVAIGLPMPGEGAGATYSAVFGGRARG